jgi:hypothetical protein
MTMTVEHNDVLLLKNKIFELSDEFQTLYRSYEALSVVASGNSGDPVHVASIVYGLNYWFEFLLTELGELYQKADGSGLRVVR